MEFYNYKASHEITEKYYFLSTYDFSVTLLLIFIKYNNSNNFLKFYLWILFVNYEQYLAFQIGENSLQGEKNEGKNSFWNHNILKLIVHHNV